MNLKPLGTNKTELDLGEGRKLLFSYETPVAYTFNTSAGRVFWITNKFYSRTTTRHINSWLPRADAIEVPQEQIDSMMEVQQCS